MNLVNKYGKKIVSGAIFIIIVGLFINYVSQHGSDFKELYSIGICNIWVIALIGMVFFSIILSNGFLLRILVKAFSLDLCLKEIIALPVVTNFYNLITPFRGGIAARAVYLKKKHAFPYVQFIATLSAIYVIIFFVSSAVGLFSVFYIWIHYGLFNSFICGVFSIAFTLMVLIIVFSRPLSERKNRWLNYFIEVINGWHLIRNNRRIVFGTAVIALIQLFLNALVFILSYSFFEIKISIVQALFISSVGSIALIFAVTPGNLGVGDAVYAFSATVIGIGLTEAVAAAVLKRAIQMLVILVLGPIFSYLLFRHVPN